jgi:hypothetical protein
MRARIEHAQAEENPMSSTEAPGRHSHGTPEESHEPHDPVENVVGAIPLVLPVMGGILMFLLAFIAVYMA